MTLSWLDPEHPDERELAGAVAVLEAARAVDAPHRLAGETVNGFTARLRHGTEGNPPAAAVLRDGAGRVTAVLTIGLPRWANPHLATVQVTVDPQLRRHGLGRQLFEAGVDQVRGAGRRLVCATCFDQTAGVGFLKAVGFDRALEMVFRRLDVLAVDWSRLGAEYAEAQRRAGGYELVRMPGAVPAELLPEVVTMAGSINDAPTGTLDIEDEVFCPQRIRAYEAAQQAHGRRLYRLVARERGTGALAGHTVVAVERDRPWLAWQHDTSVVRAHRGHRLGLLLKIGMLRWLREAEPQLRAIDTGNAAANAHMIRVNEALGFRPYTKLLEWQRHL